MTAAGLPSGGALSIGAVLTRLKPDFPDVSISKIRFLESEGLVTPERTPSGYRQFSPADVARLRYVLAAQRDQYLPLKVIKEALEALDAGRTAESSGPRLPRALASTDAVPEPGRLPMTRSELLTACGLTQAQLRELEQIGLVHLGGAGLFDPATVAVARSAGELLAAGLEPRHLRPLRGEADRGATLIGQLVAAGALQKNPDARERAEATAAQLASTLSLLHARLVLAGLKRELGN